MTTDWEAGGADSPEFLRAILDSIQDGVYFADRERRITYWNSGAEALTGYLRQEVIGRRCPENLLRHCTAEGVELCESGCPLEASLTDGQPREAFVFLGHKRGYRVPVRLRVTAVRDAQGGIVGAAEVFEEHGFAHASAHPAQTTESPDLADRLTGLCNRQGIAAKLAERVRELAQGGAAFGILLVGIDGLPQINRNFGRDAGDGVLRMAATTLAKGVAAQHPLGRWEGDQFLALLDNCDSDMLASVAGRLRAMMANSSIQWWDQPVRVTVSVGGAMAQAGDDDATILDRAVTLLAALQQAGGDACQVA